MSEQTHIVLTAAELAAMQAEAEAEIAVRLGNEPTIDSLTAQGVIQVSATRRALDFIGDTSRVVTLFVAEVVQSVGALIIAVLFGVLEYERVFHGALALGQSAAASSTIAVAVVAANFIVPIYVLRTERGAAQKTIRRATLKSRAQSFKLWVTGEATTETVAWSYNPTLKVAKSVITITTLFLAVYDLIGPALDVILSGVYQAADGSTLYLPIIIVEILMGLGLSFAGVFFLQAASHEIGVRLLTERPAQDSVVLARERAKHVSAADAIRAEIRARHEAAKQARLEEKARAKANPTIAAVSPSPLPSTNGHTHYQPAAVSE